MKMTRSRRSRSTRSQKRRRSKSQKGGTNIPDGAVVIIRDPEDPQAPPVAMSYANAKKGFFREETDISPSIRPRRHLSKQQIEAMQAGRAAARARRISGVQV